MQISSAVNEIQSIDMLTDVKSDNVYTKQLEYFPDNIAPVNITAFTPAVEMNQCLDSITCMLNTNSKFTQVLQTEEQRNIQYSLYGSCFQYTLNWVYLNTEITSI